jgi:hypothetical protein
MNKDQYDFLKRMERIASTRPNGAYDPSRAHQVADKLMCRILRKLGYGDGVEVFEKMGKWYD